MYGTCYRMPGGILLHGSKKGKCLNVRYRQDADEQSANAGQARRRTSTLQSPPGDRPP